MVDRGRGALDNTVEARIALVESRENELIQHIRTAGLQKIRENNLVEEVMELRKLRRQLVASCRQQVTSVYEQVLRDEQLAQQWFFLKEINSHSMNNPLHLLHPSKTN